MYFSNWFLLKHVVKILLKIIFFYWYYIFSDPERRLKFFLRASFLLQCWRQNTKLGLGSTIFACFRHFDYGSLYSSFRPFNGLHWKLNWHLAGISPTLCLPLAIKKKRNDMVPDCIGYHHYDVWNSMRCYRLVLLIHWIWID